MHYSEDYAAEWEEEDYCGGNGDAVSDVHVCAEAGVSVKAGLVVVVIAGMEEGDCMRG